MLCAAIGAALSGLVFFVLHVTGSGSFPRPLTAAEEKDCLERMQRGDASGKAELIEHNLRLVAHIIKKYYSNSAEQDDLISIGTIGLIKAVNTFDSSKGIRLSSYAARCIENALLTLRNHLSADCLFFPPEPPAQWLLSVPTGRQDYSNNTQLLSYARLRPKSIIFYFPSPLPGNAT